MSSDPKSSLNRKNDKKAHEDMENGQPAPLKDSSSHNTSMPNGNHTSTTTTTTTTTTSTTVQQSSSSQQQRSNDSNSNTTTTSSAAPLQKQPPFSPKSKQICDNLSNTLFDIFLEDVTSQVVEQKTHNIAKELVFDTSLRRRLREKEFSGDSQDVYSLLGGVNRRKDRESQHQALLHATGFETDEEDEEEGLQLYHSYSAPNPRSSTHQSTSSLTQQQSHSTSNTQSTLNALQQYPLAERNPVISNLPLDQFTQRVTLHMDQIYQQYAWKMEWYELQQASLRRYLLDQLEEKLAGESSQEKTTKRITRRKSRRKSIKKMSTSPPVDLPPVDTHPLHPSINKLDIQLDDIPLEHLQAALHMNDTETYEKMMKTIMEKEQIQAEEHDRNRRPSSQKRKTNKRKRSPAQVQSTPQKKEEVIIPTFKIIEETEDDINSQTIANIQDEYQSVFASLERTDDTITILDLALDKYPYQVHLEKELKEKRRIWRCWNGGTLREPEDMSEEERKRYETTILPKMPKFKVQPESYLFSPVPSSDYRGNYESMKVKSQAFWKKKLAERAKKRAEEAEKRNRKKRKRKTVYREYSDDEDELMMMEDEIEQTHSSSQPSSKRPRISQDEESPVSTTTIRKRRSSSREGQFKLTLKKSDEKPVVPLYVADQDTERWQLTGNSGNTLNWRDALAGRSRFLLRFSRVAPARGFTE